jgi:hypothetical protein
MHTDIYMHEELDGPAVSALRCEIAEVKQRWSFIGWVTKNLLPRAPPYFERHVKFLVPAAFAVVSTHQPALGRVMCYGPFSLCVIHKEGLCLSSGVINRLLMMIIITLGLHFHSEWRLQFLQYLAYSEQVWKKCNVYLSHRNYKSNVIFIISNLRHKITLGFLLCRNKNEKS